jgi:hypothetical protein
VDISHLGDICGILFLQVNTRLPGAMISTEELSKLFPIRSSPPVSSKASWLSMIAAGPDSSKVNTRISIDFETAL